MRASPELPRFTAGRMAYPLAYTQAGTVVPPQAGPHATPSHAGPRPAGPLLLIHGSLCDYRYWRWQLPALGRHHHVVAPSLRGYWPRPFMAEDPSFNVAQHADDLAELLRHEIGEGPAHVVGHSRGAHVALELACRAPELVCSLVLADPGVRMGDAQPPSTYLLDAVEKLRAGQPDEAMAAFIDAVSGKETWRSMVGWFKDMVRDNAYTLLSQLNEAGARFDVARAAGLTCPVLLLGGQNSPARYRLAMDALQPHLAHAQRDTIPMASHGMNLGNPRAFNARVLRFLDEISATSCSPA